MPCDFTVVLLWVVLGSIALGVLLLAVWLITRNWPATTGAEGMTGKTGVVVQALAPSGKILIEGEYWKARADRVVPEGATVAITGFKGLVLLVTPAEEE